MDQLSPMHRVRAGRPTRAQAEQRHEELLDRALELFLERGYEQATIEAIAAAVGMTKRTVYARYEDKSALFKATVQRAIEQFIVPIEKLEAVESDDLEETLVAVAHIRLANVMTPAGIKLQRIINTESYRFPGMFTSAFELITKPTIKFLADLLDRHNADGTTEVANSERAATIFMSMVIGGPTRMVVSGNTLDPVVTDENIRFAVRLFLNGIRRR